MAAWYFGKFIFGLTGMIYVYLTYLQKKDPAVCVCASIQEHFQREGQDNVEFCPDRNNSDVTVKKDCGTESHSLVAVLDQSQQTREQSASVTTMTTMTTTNVLLQPRQPTKSLHRQPQRLKRQPTLVPKSQQPVIPNLQSLNLNPQTLPPLPNAVVPVAVVSLEKAVESVEVVIKKQIEQQIKRPKCSCNRLRKKRTRKRKLPTTTSLENLSTRSENTNVRQNTCIDRMEEDFHRTLRNLDRLDRTFSAIPRHFGTKDKSHWKNEGQNHVQRIAWWHTKVPSNCSSNSTKILSSTLIPRNTVKHYSSRNYAIKRNDHDR